MTFSHDRGFSVANRTSASHGECPSSPELPGLPSWPPEWPEIAQSVAEVIRSGDWGRYRGDCTEALGRRLAEITDCQSCRLVASGSFGIELALRSCGVGSGQQVALCGYDYPGNFRAIELLGAKPLLIDADSKNYSLSPEVLHRVEPTELKAVVVSHLYGVAASIADIAEICQRKGWYLIEDACQTPGMMIAGRAAGSWGDVGVLSFGGSKPLTAGSGGAVVTDDVTLASKWKAFLDRPSDATPLSELQAAALLPQLDRLNQCNRIRSETLMELLDQVPALSAATGFSQPGSDATCYKLAFLSEDRNEAIRRLAARGVPVGAGYRSMHRSSKRRCDKVGALPRCQLLGEQLCLLDHSALLATGIQREGLLRALRECL